MEEVFSSGIAFVFEGDTEKVFYHTMLLHFLKKHPDYTFTKQKDDKTGETYYVLSSDSRSVLIKLNNVGTVSQITNSAFWFNNRCYKKYKPLGWTVFLCYDTDSYNNDIGKFHEGDWKDLRESITKNRKCNVVDLAAQADIEDIMLLDVESIYKYLSIEPVQIPSGKKGKRKMKKLFRLAGDGMAYHEGERARLLIESLDMDKIISKSSIPFIEIEKTCFF